MHGRNTTMRLLNIGPHDRQITLDHVQCAVTRQALQCLWISIITQVFDRTGMAEYGDLGNPLQDGPQAIK